MCGPAEQTERDRIAAILVTAEQELAQMRLAMPAGERFRWRRAEAILLSAAAMIGVPDLFSSGERPVQSG